MATGLQSEATGRVAAKSPDPRKSERKIMQHRATYKLDGNELKVTNVKFILLSILVSGMDAKEFVPTDYIADELYQHENSNREERMNRLKVHICQLRKQLKPIGYEIISSYGAGYMMRKKGGLSMTTELQAASEELQSNEQRAARVAHFMAVTELTCATPLAAVERALKAANKMEE